jgi:fatty-acyl-CoA synthase
VIVDKSLLPLWEQVKDKTEIEHVLVVEDSYEELLAGADPDDYEDPKLDEDTAAAMCYTSGTTGMPKASSTRTAHRPAHARPGARSAAWAACDREGDPAPRRADVPRERLGLPVHLPDGRSEARLPGPVPRPRVAARRLRAAQRDDHSRVPTIWMGILGMLDKEPDRWDLSSLHSMLVGGSRRRAR